MRTAARFSEKEVVKEERDKDTSVHNIGLLRLGKESKRCSVIHVEQIQAVSAVQPLLHYVFSLFSFMSRRTAPCASPS